MRLVSAKIFNGPETEDPTKLRVSADLQRRHRILQTQTQTQTQSQSLLASALNERMRPFDRKVTRILELGAVDGSLMLQVAGSMRPQPRTVEITFLDQKLLLSDTTISAFREIGWVATANLRDVMEWCGAPAVSAPIKNEINRWDFILANSFLHRFTNAQLTVLLNLIAQRGNHFIAYEPRRSGFAMAANRVSYEMVADPGAREAALLSVQGGFNDHELTALWPQQEHTWRLQEQPTGPFNKCFIADRQMRDPETEHVAAIALRAEPGARPSSAEN